MKSSNRLVLFSIVILLNLACLASGTALPTPTSIPPSATPFKNPFPTLTPAPTPTPLYPTEPPVPAWVTDFADPILKAVVDRKPDLQDDFSPFNKGWFMVNPGNSKRPYYADVHEGALYLQLPEPIGRKEITVYHHSWARKDFVLSFDFKFGKTEPDDILRFQYGQTAEESVSLDLSKNENWTFTWKLFSSSEATTGTYDYFSPEYLNVNIIMRGDKCAVYLNNTPVAYSDTCRHGPIAKPSRTTMTFHLIGTGRPVLVIMDNVKLWDLEKIPEIP